MDVKEGFIWPTHDNIVKSYKEGIGEAKILRDAGSRSPRWNDTESHRGLQAYSLTATLRGPLQMSGFVHVRSYWSV